MDRHGYLYPWIFNVHTGVSSGSMVAPPYGTLVRRSYNVFSNFAWWSRRIVGRPVSRLVAEGDASCPLESFESAC